MAGYGNPNWVKGVSGNPSGRAGVPPELRMIKALGVDEVNRLVAKYGRMTVYEVRLFLEDESRPILDQAICKIFLESYEKGDHTKLNFLLDRAIGKPKEMVIDAGSQDSRKELQELSTTELLSIVRKHFDKAG